MNNIKNKAPKLILNFVWKKMRPLGLSHKYIYTFKS